MSNKKEMYFFMGGGCPRCEDMTGLYDTPPGRPHEGCGCPIIVLDPSNLDDDILSLRSKDLEGVFSSEEIEEIMEREAGVEAMEDIIDRREEGEEEEAPFKWDEEDKEEDEGDRDARKRAWEEKFNKLFKLFYEKLKEEWIDENGEENFTDEIHEQLEEKAKELALEKMKP